MKANFRKHGLQLRPSSPRRHNSAQQVFVVAHRKVAIAVFGIIAFIPEPISTRTSKPVVAESKDGKMQRLMNGDVQITASHVDGNIKRVIGISTIPFHEIKYT